MQCFCAAAHSDAVLATILCQAKRPATSAQWTSVETAGCVCERLGRISKVAIKWLDERAHHLHTDLRS